MSTKKWSKLILSIVLVSLLTTNFNFPKVHAETAQETTRSMIEFFRNENTNLSVSRVTKDETLVYGVFLSNFYIPWVTTFADVTDTTSENSVVKKVTEKFFGSSSSESVSSVVAELHDKIFEAIGDGLASADRAYTLFPNNQGKLGGSPLTGKDLLRKMAGVADTNTKKVDTLLYNVDGNPVMDLSDQATQAAWKVIIGQNPQYFFEVDKGLNKIDAMFLDSLGNIWGSYDGANSGKYVLILPAALNPVVFSNQIKGAKFPMSNVFTMGAVISKKGDMLANQKMTPYYNISEYFPVDTSSTTNIVSIFGVHSPSNYIGNSDSIIKGGSSMPKSTIDNFMEYTFDNEIKSDDGFIVLSVDLSNSNLDSKAFDSYKESDGFTTTAKSNLISYAMKSLVFGINQIDDRMYYFKVPNTNNAYGASEGSWDSEESLLMEQNLFTKAIYSGDDNKVKLTDRFQFYSNSILISPYVNFLHQYKGLSSSEQDTFLNNKLNNGKAIDSKVLPVLKKFLNTGTYAENEAATMVKVFKLLSGDNSVFDILEPSNAIAKIKTKNRLFWMNYYEATGFGLTETDKAVSTMSVAAKNSSLFEQSYKTPETSSSFSPDKGGGSLVTKDATSSTVTDSINLFNHFMVYNIFTMNNTFTSKLEGTGSGSGSKKFKTPWQDDYTVNTDIKNEVNNFPGIYWGYMTTLLNISKDADGKWTNSSYSNSYLPYFSISVAGGNLNLNDVFGATGLTASEDKNFEEMQKDVLKKVYGILSDGPNSYRDSLVKSTQDSWIISTHRNITGSWTGNVLSVSAVGNNSYASIVGFISTPSLHDLPLTSWLLTDYMYIYLVLMIVILIILVVMVLTNNRTIREGILILLLMSFILILPQFLVGNVINISNKVGDQLYSGKFNFWAITQHQQTASALKTVLTSDNEADYTIAVNNQNNSNMYTTDVGVRIKWMAPKRDSYFDRLFNSENVTQTLMNNLTIFRWLFSSTVNQEEYVYNDPLATYLYRPYLSVINDAKDSYNNFVTTPTIRETELIDALKNTNNPAPFKQSYTFSKLTDPSKVKYTPAQSELIEKVGVFSPTSSTLTAEQLNSYRYWGLTNTEITKKVLGDDFAGTDPGLRMTEDDLQFKAFTLLTESPFTYFYNVFAHRYSEGGKDFISSLLNPDVFIANYSNSFDSVNYQLRDFLDLEGLFTYVIPYLDQSNQYVSSYINIHGSTVTNYNGAEPDVLDPNYALYQEQQKQKENMRAIWKMYSPWVDHLYQLDITHKKVRVADSPVYVTDTLNPGAYDEQGRPMIFSPADMEAKGYKVSDLSDVEMRLQRVLETTYRDLMYLANYIDFDDEVVMSAAAMMATFNFNREFSETNLLGESVTLYPQNFELKNFNYDAFLRLILLNATGESVMGDKDLYVRVLEKTSIFTGILLLAVDVVAIIAVPTMKVIVLLLLLFLSTVLVFACLITPPAKIGKFLMTHLFYPVLFFLLATVGFAYVVSLFMGEGLSTYVGSRMPTVGMTDPTTTLALLLLVSIAYVAVLGYIAFKLLKALKANTLSAVFGSVALAASLGQSAVRGVTGKIKEAVNGVASVGGLGTKAYQKHKANERHEELIDAVRGGNSGGSTRSGDLGSAVSPNMGSKQAPIDSKTDLSSFLDERASTFAPPAQMQDSNTQTNTRTQQEFADPVVARKKLSHKFIDAKMATKNTLSSAREGLSYAADRNGLYKDVKTSAKNTLSSVKDGVGYVAGKDGLYSDVANKVKSERNSMNQYEIAKLKESIAQQERKVAFDPSGQRRLNKDTARLSDLERGYKLPSKNMTALAKAKQKD